MSALDTISHVTGIGRPAMDAILAEVKENQRILSACQFPHDFSICIDRHSKVPIENPTPAQRFGAKWKCSKCGGIVDSMHKIHYNEGLEHGRKSTTAI
jgi:hypothetical protein